MKDDPAADPPARASRSFATTRWSVVLRAGRGSDTAARMALARLCTTYWYPLYAHARRRGHSSHDAEDITQGFFAQVLRRQDLDRADPARGRFRSFLLTALDHFIHDEWKKRHPLKRDGGSAVFSLDLADAEHRFGHEPVAADAPDREFDRRWAVALLETVLHQLEADYVAAGKTELFIALRPTLLGADNAQPYAAIAGQLATSEEAVKVAVHRLRRRYRDLLRAEIEETVTCAEEAEAELRHLFRALAEE